MTSKDFLRPYYKILMGMAVFMAIYDAVLWAIPDKTTIWNYLFNGVYGLVYFFVAYICYSGIKLTKGVEAGRIARALRYWAFGFAFWGFGQVVWLFYNIVLKVEVPYPSLADLFFIAFYLPIGLGIMNLKAIEPLRKKTFLGEFVTILPLMLAIFMVIFGYLKLPDFSELTDPLIASIDIFYIIGDAFLLSIALTGLSSMFGSFKSAYTYLLVGLSLAAIGDILFTYKSAHDSYWNGGMADICFALFPIVFGLGVIKILAQKTPKGRT